jgi:hypothetical protein
LRWGLLTRDEKFHRLKRGKSEHKARQGERGA